MVPVRPGTEQQHYCLLSAPPQQINTTNGEKLSVTRQYLSLLYSEWR